ncbi:MAG: VOC family protein [Spirochaetales bacterium]|nr:VOC family protein [Spirochaetales bacterium]
MMKYVAPCIAVNNIEESRDFYENLLGQRVKYDFGENITYEGMFSIQLKPHFAKMINLSTDELKTKPNNFEITFETEDLDAFIKKLKNSKYDVVYLHDIIEHEWGQRVIRFYDPSQNVIEVGEDMKVVCIRYLNKGMSIEETAAKTQFPVEFVKNCKKQHS